MKKHKSIVLIIILIIITILLIFIFKNKKNNKFQDDILFFKTFVPFKSAEETKENNIIQSSINNLQYNDEYYIEDEYTDEEIYIFDVEYSNIYLRPVNLANTVNKDKLTNMKLAPRNI